MWRMLARRWWLAALLLIVLLTAAALAWTTSPASPHTYTATRTLRISVLPADDVGAYGSSVAQASEASIARNLAASSLLSSSTYTSAVIGQLGGSRAFSMSGRLLTSADVGQTLRASHAGGDVTLSASWDSADGASALADAAVRALAEQAVGADAVPTDGASLHTVVEGVGTPGHPDTGADAARVTDLLTRGALAALAVLIVAGALAAVEMAQGRWATAESARN